MNKARILNYIMAVVLLVLVIKLAFKETPKHEIIINTTGSDTTVQNQRVSINTTHQVRVWLTVAESKRLIAKGLKNYAPVKERLANGYILITKGTTNTYVAEEFLNDSLGRGDYVLGHILPATGDKKLDRSIERKELIFKDGQIVDTAYVDVLKKMTAGDIIFKGANIINYKKGQAGVLIGHPTGGTTGNFYPLVNEKKLRLIIPVGLEKDSSTDIDILSEYSKIPHEEIAKNTPYLWSIKGELFTEIEAIKQFADVEPLHLASGGIGGAEGAVTINIRGSKEEVEKALAAVQSIQGEKPFLK